MAPRVLKEHDERRNELLDAAQRLFVERGYDETPVSAIIDAVGVAKGTFYHYFKSKEDLLDALVERITVRIFEETRKAVEGVDLDAIGRLNLYFKASSRWKAANREALMAIIKPAYAESNTRLRRKLAQRSIGLGAPMLAELFRQGIEEGVFDTEYPDEMAEMVLVVAFAFRELHARQFIEEYDKPETWHVIIRRVLCYQRAVEKMLGAPKGSLRMADEEAMKAFRPPGAEVLEEERMLWGEPEGVER